MQAQFKKFPKEEIKTRLKGYFEGKPAIDLAYLFGSVAEERQSKTSDLDVAVLVNREELPKLDKKAFGFQASLVTDLMTLLNTNNIDTVILNNATPLLSYEVARYGEVIYCRDLQGQIEFELRARHRYLDTKPLRAIQEYYFKERVRKKRHSRIELAMVKKDVVRCHLMNLEQAVGELEKHLDRPEEDLRTDLSYCWAVEHGLQITIQNMIDIGAHILSADMKNDWNDYTEVIDKMGQHGMLPKEFCKKIRQYAGLRNIIVHRYLDVNLNVIYDVLQNHIQDFKDYISYYRKLFGEKVRIVV